MKSVEWRYYSLGMHSWKGGTRGERRKESEGEARRTSGKWREKRGSVSFGWLIGKKEEEKEKNTAGLRYSSGRWHV